MAPLTPTMQVLKSLHDSQRWRTLGPSDPTAAISCLALEVWQYCAGDSLVLGKSHLDELLALISACSPRQLAGVPQRQVEMFVRSEEVHFLDFWRAFRDAVVGDAVSSVRVGGLAGELESLRDRVLSLFERRLGARAKIQLWTLVGEMHRLAPTSSSPNFWRAALASLTTQNNTTDLDLMQLANILIPLIEKLDHGPLGQEIPSEAHSPGLAVRLQIYDCTLYEQLRVFNQLFAHELSPLKVGGIFHACVEVAGLEWSFDQQTDQSKPAVSCSLPRMNSQHNYRQTIFLGVTTLPKNSIADVISELIKEYPACRYHVLRRNCCTFANDLAIRLGVGGIPDWVHRFARLGAKLESAVMKAKRAVAPPSYGAPTVALPLKPADLRPSKPELEDKCSRPAEACEDAESEAVCADVLSI